AGRLENFEGRVELVFGVMHGMGMPRSGCQSPRLPVMLFGLQYASNRAIVHGCRAVAKAFARVHSLFTRGAANGRRDHKGTAARSATVNKGSMPKILLAEDDTDMRRFLVKALQNAGYDVISYDNGLSAYQRLREEPFELLLTDIVMPEMDGIELARRASEL